jgi:2-dehydro-3-deoxyphosphogluconate aldolase/(4S)-4-hydroxy-2-oxoglutarate aldolase
MQLRSLLRSRRLVAIVRGRSADAALRSVLALAAEGVELIEVSLTTDKALDVLTRARAELGPSAALGAGTVLTARDAGHARAAGAAFVVTPGLGAGADEAIRLGLPALVGAFTPSEVIAAGAAGAAAVKLFPAAQAGGPAYLKALRGPFPEVDFVPVGGVDAGTGRAYLRAGATAIGVGRPLLGDAADGGDLDALRHRARGYLRAIGDFTVPRPPGPEAGA